MKAKDRLLFLPVLLVMLLAHAQKSYAVDYMKNSINYQVFGAGPSVMFMLPVYDKDGRDMWVINGSQVSVKLHGSDTKHVVFTYNVPKGDIANSATDVTCEFKSVLGGTLKAKDKSGNWVNISSTGTSVTVHSDADGFLAELQWDAPHEWRGKPIDFEVEAYGRQNSTLSQWSHSQEFNNITLMAPPAKVYPNIAMTMISTSSAYPKSVAVIWQIAASEVTRAVAKYKVDGMDDMQTLANEPYGTFYVPSDKVVTDLYVEVDYNNSEGSLVTGVTSDKQDILPFHQAKGLTALLNKDGKVTLKWSVDQAERTDIMPTDYFLVERNLQGSPLPESDNWQALGQVAYTADQKDYTFTDEDLLSRYEDTLVVYRVQRASVTSIWGYSANSGAVLTQLPQQLVLPRPLDFKVEKAENKWTQEKHAVDVSWTLEANQADPVAVFTINNVEDWTQFCNTVSAGVHVDAVLTSDIDLMDCQDMAGSQPAPFTGTFDGQGHTLTVHYYTEKNYSAPFRFLGNGAVIKNLTVAGDIYTDHLCIGGIAALASGTNIQISHCRSLVNIHSSKTNGAVYYGGVLGALYNKGAVCGLTLEDCLFDGMLYGTNLHLCGGLIGWSDKTNQLTMRRVAMRRVGNTQDLVDYDTSGSYHQTVPLPVND